MIFFQNINNKYNDYPKKILNNFIKITSVEILNKIIPLITIPYLIKTLTLNNYGIIAMASVFFSYFISINDYSFNITATREASLNRNNSLRLSVILSSVLYVKMIIFIVSTVIILLFINFFQDFKNEKYVFYIYIIGLFSNVISTNWLFFGTGRLTFFSLFSLFNKLALAILIFILINSEKDYILFAFISNISLLFSSLVLFIYSLSLYKIKFTKFKLNRISQIFKNNFYVFIHDIAPNLYNNSTSFILGLYCGHYILGLFTALKVFIDLIILAINLLSKVFYPFIINDKNLFNLYRQTIKYYLVVIFLFAIFFYKYFLIYINIDYEYSNFILFILMLGVLGYSIYDVYGLNFFIVRKMDKLVMQNTVIISSLGLLLSFPLTVFFGIFGAAINLSLVRLIMGYRLYYLFKRKYEFLY